VIRSAPCRTIAGGAALLLPVVAAMHVGCAPVPERGDGDPIALGAALLAAEGYSGITPSNGGNWLVGVRPGSPPPLGELHAREIAIEPASGDRTRLAGIAIEVDCTMPQHRHGMNVVPEVERLAPGRFAVRGLELFMEGEWLFTVDIVDGDRTERTEWWVEPR